MRNCPVCFDSRRNLIRAQYAIPIWSMFRCVNCNMLYLDSEVHTEKSMNEFYNNVYKTADLNISDDRLNSLMQCLVDMPISWGDQIMDIGGMDGVLSLKLKDRGFTNVWASGPGASFEHSYKTFILSHTLEHVYNTHGMLENIKAYIEPGGWVVVEVPIWSDDSPLTYDYHFEHINKFTPKHLENLFIQHGFTIHESYPLPKYIEYNCHRLVAKYG